MERCEKCIHYAACYLWSNHGRFLTDDCPFFSDREWGRYIKLEDLQKFPIREDHCDKEHGNEHFIYGVETVLEYAEYLPTYDVVPKSEYDAVVSAVDNSTKEFLKLHDKYQEQMAENERLTYLLHCYALQYGTVTDQQKVIDKAKAEVLEEFEERIATHAFTSKSEDYSDGAFDTIAWVDTKLTELKKKYQEGEPNGN